MSPRNDVSANPLLLDWSGPHGGVPPFDRVEVAHFQPALEAAMDEKLVEIEELARDPEPPSFENTIATLERSGRKLDRVLAVYGVWTSTMSTPELQAVEQEMAPKLAAFADRIMQNEALFRRIEAVYESRDGQALTPEQHRLAWRYYTDFVRAGAKLDAAAKARLSEINQRLATLFTRFSQNVLADESNQYLVVESEAELEGLPESFRIAAAASAKEKGLEGKWVIENTRSSMAPFLAFADRRELREKAFRIWTSRGEGGEHDNGSIITEILKLRAERAKLLGYETHAHYRLEDSMAKTPERAVQLLEAVWEPAVARVRQEVADMQAIAKAEGNDIAIEPWDYLYYAEKVRKARYDLDQNQVKPYLQLEKLREGLFWVAGELLGFDFRAAEDIPVYHPDVRVWEVLDRATQRHVGLFYFDPFARPGKQSGAWMSAYRRQERFDSEVTTIVSNNANFVKGAPGEPVLISWDDARTLFHEFGHALHGLASSVSYPSLSGTSVPRDYVELPSQLLEHWLETPELLQRYAVHYQTGEPLPAELVEKLEEASTFNQGFATTEYLASALVDMKMHLAANQEIEPKTFEKQVLDELGMPREVIMRHRLPHFLHVFATDGYSAGYYSYLWADVLTADVAEAFREARGLYDREVADRLRRHVLEVGDTIDPAEGYRQFRGRDARIEALLRDRGFEPAQSSAIP